MKTDGEWAPSGYTIGPGTLGTLPGQEVLVGTLEDIAEKAKISGFPPAVIVVGKWLNYGRNLTGLIKPLFGKTIVVTGQGHKLVRWWQFWRI